jgi:cytochrome c-type biogenesis protein CcmH
VRGLSEDARIFVLCTMLAFGALWPRLAAGTEKASVAGVSQGLTCQCGCGLTVANCNHPTCSFSVPVRDEIEKMIGQGNSGPEIIAFYRHKYGEKVLSAPTTEGFNILAWLMPFLAVALGAALVVYTASRWKSRSTQAGSPRPEALQGPVDADLLRRLKSEVRERS